MCNLKGNPSTLQQANSNTQSNTNSTSTMEQVGSQDQTLAALNAQLSQQGPTPETLALYMQLLNDTQQLGQTQWDASTAANVAPWTDAMNQAVNAQYALGQQGMQFVPDAAAMIGQGGQSTIGQIPGLSQQLLSPWAQQAVDFGMSQGNAIGNWGTTRGDAISDYGQALAAQGPQLQQFSAGAIQQYQSPYTQQVVDATQDWFNNTNAIQGSALLGQGIKQGNAFGGDRAGVAQGVLAGQQQLAQAPVIAGLYDKSYAQALQQFNMENQLATQLGQIALGGMTQGAQIGSQALQAQGALGMQGLNMGLNASTAANQQAIAALSQNQNAALQAGQLFGNLGSTQFGQNLQGGQQAIQSAGIYPSYLQNLMNVSQQNALGIQAYPFQTSSWYGGLLGGLGPLTGTQGSQISSFDQLMNAILSSQGTNTGTSTNTSVGNTTGSTTPPQPNGLSQILGLGLAGLSGLLSPSDERVKEDMEQVGRTNDGQPIYRFRYAGDPKTHMGLSAQEVEQRNPDAVEEVGGLKLVDYKMATEDAVRHALGGLVANNRRAEGGLVANNWNDAPYHVVKLPGGVTVATKTPVPELNMRRGSQMTLPQPLSPRSMPGLQSLPGMGQLPVAQAAAAPRLPSGTATTQANPLTQALGNFISKPGNLQSLGTSLGFKHGGLIQHYADGGWDTEDTEDNSMSEQPWLEGGPVAEMQPQEAQALAPEEDTSLPENAQPTEGATPMDFIDVIEARKKALGFTPGQERWSRVPGQQQRQPPGRMEEWANNPLTRIGLAMAGGNSPNFLSNLTTGLGAGAYAASAQGAQRARQDKLDNNYKIDNSGMEQTIRFADGRIFHTGMPTPRGLQLTSKQQPAEGRIPAGYRKTADGNLEAIPGGPGAKASSAGPTPVIVPEGDTRVAEAAPAAPEETAKPFAYFTEAAEQSPPEQRQSGLLHTPVAGVNPQVLVEADKAYPGMGELIKSISEGRRAMPAVSRNPNAYSQALIGYLHQYDKNIDGTVFPMRQRTANEFAVGMAGKNLVAVNTLGTHMLELHTLSGEMKESGYPSYNALKNAVSRQGFADEKQQALLGRYDIASKAIADEGAKVFAGQQSALADREEWIKQLAPTNSEAVIREKLQQLSKLVGGRVQSLADQYNRGMRAKYTEKDFMSPETKHAYDTIMSFQGPSGLGGKSKAAPLAEPATGGSAPPASTGGEGAVMRKQFQTKNGPAWGVSTDGGKTWRPE